MTRSASLRCRSLVAGFDGRAITPPVDLEAQAGEVWAVMGRNGAGKTTLLRTWLGLLKPVSGSVEVQGRILTDLSHRERARLVAYVPQRETEGLDLSAHDYVATARFAHSGGLWETDDDRGAIRRALEWAGLTDFAKPLSQFSGGERQRLTLARAMAQQTPLVLMDEPATHLDPGQSRRLGQTVLDLAAQGKTLFVVTHDVAWAMRYASHSVLLTPSAASGPTPEILTDAALETAFA